jgi:O-antigen polysaccharide polymerase Wzy
MHSFRFTVIFVFLCWGLAMLFCAPELFNVSGMTFLALGTWLAALGCLRCYSKNGVFSLPFVYLAILGLFHLGHVVPVTLGAYAGEHSGWMSGPYLIKSLALCCAAFSFMAVGVAGANSKKKSSAQLAGGCCKDNPGRLPASRGLFGWGIFITIVGFAVLGYGFISLGLRGASYYESYAIRGTQDPRIFGVGFMFALMGFVIAAAGARPRQFTWLFPAFLIAFSPMFLFGYRGQVIVFLITGLIIWHLKAPRTARRVAFFAFLAVFIAAPGIKLLRNSKEMRLSDALVAARPLVVIQEAGHALRPLKATLAQLDRGESYWWGSSYLNAASRVVPNIRPYWRAPSRTYATAPAQWITMEVLPWDYEHFGGMGYSAIAEPYLNFGPAGVCVFFLLLGFLLARFDPSSFCDVFHLAIITCVFAGLLWTVRNDIANMTRPALWGAMVVLIIRHLVLIPAKTKNIVSEAPDSPGVLP